MTATATAAKKTAKKAAKKAVKKAAQAQEAIREELGPDSPITEEEIAAQTQVPTSVVVKAKEKSKKRVGSTRSSRPPAYSGEKGELRRPQIPNHQMPDGQIVIQRIDTETLRIPIVGITPLITHKFSEKAKRQMLDAMQGNKKPKEPKDPEREFRDAAYRHDDDGYGLPAIAFKSCTVSAARYWGKSVTMVGLRQTIFVAGEFSSTEGMMLARINPEDPDDEPIMREDVVRVGNGGTDLRYRPCWYEWHTTLDVTYVKSMLTGDSVISLVEAGGLGVGVGEWRPERRGEYGTFCIDEEKGIQVLKN